MSDGERRPIHLDRGRQQVLMYRRAHRTTKRKDEPHLRLIGTTVRELDQLFTGKRSETGHAPDVAARLITLWAEPYRHYHERHRMNRVFLETKSAFSERLADLVEAAEAVFNEDFAARLKDLARWLRDIYGFSRVSLDLKWPVPTEEIDRCRVAAAFATLVIESERPDFADVDAPKVKKQSRHDVEHAPAYSTLITNIRVTVFAYVLDATVFWTSIGVWTDHAGAIRTSGLFPHLERSLNSWFDDLKMHLTKQSYDKLDLGDKLAWKQWAADLRGLVKATRGTEPLGTQGDPQSRVSKCAAAIRAAAQVILNQTQDVIQARVSQLASYFKLPDRPQRIPPWTGFSATDMLGHEAGHDHADSHSAISQAWAAPGFNFNTFNPYGHELPEGSSIGPAHDPMATVHPAYAPTEVWPNHQSGYPLHYGQPPPFLGFDHQDLAPTHAVLPAAFDHLSLTQHARPTPIAQRPLPPFQPAHDQFLSEPLHLQPNLSYVGRGASDPAVPYPYDIEEPFFFGNHPSSSYHTLGHGPVIARRIARRVYGLDADEWSRAKSWPGVRSG